MDAVTSLQFETAINDLAVAGETGFVIDFKGLDYISSAGLRSLLAIGKQLKGSGGQLYLANVSETVRKIFDFSGISSIFHIDDSVAAALARFS